MKETIRVAAPAMIESFFAAVVTFVDSKMVSSLGTAAVASIALTQQPILLRLTPLTAINIATAALVARRKGEGKQNAANEVMVTSVLLAMTIALVLSIVFFFTADPLIEFAGSQSDTHDNAVLYFRVICCVTVFTAFQNCVCAAHRGAGFTRISMQTHLVSSGLNVIMNFLLIEGRFGFPRLEIFGAALATAIGMVVASVMAMISLFSKKNYIRLDIILKEKIRPKFAVLKQVVKLAYSIFIEQVLIRVGMFASSKMAAGFGTNVMAAHKVAGNFATLSYSIGDGLQSAAVALVGRSLGQKRPDLAKTYATACRLIGAAFSIVLAVFFALLVRPLYQLFFSDPAVVEIGVLLNIPLIIIVIFQIQQVINIGTLRGAGDALFTAILGIICTTLVRPTVAYICGYPLGLGILGIWIGSLSDQIVRFAVSAFRLAKGKWTSLKI